MKKTTGKPEGEHRTTKKAKSIYVKCSTGRMKCIEHSILVEDRRCFSIFKAFLGFLNKSIEGSEQNVSITFCLKKKQWSENGIFLNTCFRLIVFSEMILTMAVIIRVNLSTKRQSERFLKRLKVESSMPDQKRNRVE